uniref:RNA-binding protein 14 n=1 Tax=Varanus komodoensis TaxID=61221 RepID=A0A8D2KR85_VARKO
MVKIFVGGLSPVVTAEELRKLFQQYGQVNECDILKNFAFVHMEKEDEAHQAISALHKSEFYGAHLTVEYATSKIRNATKIYVGNVSAKATTSQVRQLFERFGKVVECDIVKNYAFVHMAKEREAMDAILNLNDTSGAWPTRHCSVGHSPPPGPPPPFRAGEAPQRLCGWGQAASATMQAGARGVGGVWARPHRFRPPESAAPGASLKWNPAPGPRTALPLRSLPAACLCVCACLCVHT